MTDQRATARRNMAILWLVFIGLPLLAVVGYALLWGMNPLKG